MKNICNNNHDLLLPNYKMIILCIQQTTNKLEERFEGIALERLDEVTTETTEFDWEVFRLQQVRRTRTFVGKLRRAFKAKHMEVISFGHFKSIQKA